MAKNNVSQSATVTDQKQPRSLAVSPADIGPISIVALLTAYAVMWIVARPEEVPVVAWLGEAFGAEAVLLFSITLVLTSTGRRIESWFHGYDHAMIWHRRTAIVGLLLLFPHFALSSNPDTTVVGGVLARLAAAGMFLLSAWSILPRWRMPVPKQFHGFIQSLSETRAINVIGRILGGYDRWQLLHQTIVIFTAAGFVHGLLDSLTFRSSSVMTWSYLAIAGIGILAYIYRKFLAEYFIPVHHYQVDAAKTVGSGLTEVVLSPIEDPLAFVPGQFVMVSFKTKEGWQRHPFSISSSSREGVIRLTIKALGDFTSHLGTTIHRGMSALVDGPHGRFNYRSGTKRQVWIASGAGITPFLSWIRSLESDFDFEVDFFYSARGETPFVDEIQTITKRYPSFHTHFINTATQSRLTPQQVLSIAGSSVENLSVYMCGPEAMLKQFTNTFQKAGVPRASIHREYFNWR